MSKREKAQALVWCNKVRKILGRKPVKALRKGTIGNETSCALANTIGDADVTAGEVRVSVAGTPITIETPSYIEKFIDDFDAEGYPELVK